MPAFVVLVAGAILSAPSLMAQPGGMGMMNRPQMASGLLALEEVQKELEMTESQIEEIVSAAQQLNDDFRAAMRDAFTSGEDIAEIAKEFKEQDDELVAKLDDKQKTRLKQLLYQRMDIAVLRDADVAAALALTDDQKTAIDDAFASMQEKMQEMFQSGDREGMREKMGELRTELSETVMGQLTDEQKTKLDELKGEAFQFPERRRGGERRSDF
jgi:hypothetical protein